MVMLYIALVCGAAACAILAVRAHRLITSALWLAGVSALTAIMLYLIGAYTMAVIELSLSVGLITILLVLAISMVGADSPDEPVLRLFNVPLVVVTLLLMIGLALPQLAPQTGTPESSFKETFWNLRQADVLVQIGLIFLGVLGVLGLLREGHSRTRTSATVIHREDQKVEESEPVSPSVKEQEQEPEPV
jgi:NADH:ubiquinone oxidoreductase subunit 6 (subunit J)